MRRSKITATEVARKLGGLHPATIYRLRRLPGAPPINADQVEAWRDFALLNLWLPCLALASIIRRLIARNDARLSLRCASSDIPAQFADS